MEEIPTNIYVIRNKNHFDTIHKKNRIIHIIKIQNNQKSCVCYSVMLQLQFNITFKYIHTMKQHCSDCKEQ